ncbi:LpqN/LpqT family lipoprotein [Mycolicibacterium sp. XJ1819]
MTEITRRWRVLAGGVAAGVAGVLGFAGATASAEPVYPQPPQPAPVTVASQPLGQQTSPASSASPGLLTAPSVPVQPVAPITPASSGTLTDFFNEHGVTLEPQVSRDFTALNIVLPMPRGWEQVPDPNVTDAFAVIADRVGGNGLYSSNAQVVVYKLVGEFDPKEAISHGFVDSLQLPAWRTTDASMAEFGGMPSALIEGTYRENAMTLNTSRRHVIATAGPDKYLVSLAVTTTVDQVVPAAEATDAIVQGFRVSVPAPQAATAAPAAAPAPAAAVPPAPALTALPSAVGLAG